MDVIIAGGGIAGLTLALSLNQAGIAVRLYESVADPAPLGVGINIQPSAVRELTELGLGTDLAQTGIATQRLAFFNKLGQLIISEPRGIAAGYSWPQYSIHRGRLQELLLIAARARIGIGSIRCGMRFVTFKQDTNRVTARFRDTCSGAEVFDEADFLVGADGLHSAVRRQLYPHEGEPRYAGQIMWRAAVEAEPFLDGATMIIAGHFRQRVIAYPIGLAPTPGKLLTNWICQTTVYDSQQNREDWNQRAAKDKVLSYFRGWRFPWLNVPELIEQADELYEFPLVDRNPVPTWTVGHVTLIGDAAHPMQPIGSQAGSQAIIDARVLTHAFVTSANQSEALHRYEAQRRPVTTDITLRNRNFGPERFLQLVEERAPDGFSRIDEVISSEELGAISSSFATAAGIDVGSVNARRSFLPPLDGDMPSRRGGPSQPKE